MVDGRKRWRYHKAIQHLPKCLWAERRQLAIETLGNETKVYSAEEIQTLLGIGRSKVYTYLEEVYQKQEPFRVIKIGKLFRVPKQSFDNWLNGIS
nr:helix-turn-helix domain-containing protein [Enterocloster alcoholdehydrogenati]